MGFFDRLFARKSSAPPEPVGPAPGPGVITAFDGADDLGTIALEEGEAVRFGRSACRDFDPIEGLPVLAEDLEEHPLGGWRTRSVALTGEGRERLDALLDARDAEQGHEEMSFYEAVATARALGLITVLLPEAPEPGRAGVRALLEGVGASLGARLEFSPRPGLLLASGARVEVTIGREPFPRESADLRELADDFDLGRGFVSFGVGLPDFARKLRTTVGPSYPDPFGEAGTLRALTELSVRMLSRGGLGVILHRAAHPVIGAASFARKASPIDDPRSKPFGAWVDLGLDEGLLSTYGMDVFGLPDVSARLAELEFEEEAYDRAHEAVLFACHKMVRENRALEEGESFTVPLGVEVGALPLEEDNPGLTEQFGTPYQVQERDGGLELVAQRAPESLESLWARVTGSGEEMPYPAYRSMLRARAIGPDWTRVGSITYPRPIPVEVFVYASEPDTFTIFTCGGGRLKQPNGSAEDDTAHLEFVLKLEAHSPVIANSLAFLAHLLHARGPDAPPWGPQHRLSFDLADPPLHAAALVLAWSGQVEPEHGPKIGLLAPILMTEAEKTEVGTDDLPAWIETHGRAALARWLERTQ